MTTVGCALSGLWRGLEPSVSRSWLSGIAAMLVVMLALARSTSLRGLMLYLSRPALHASAALHKVRKYPVSTTEYAVSTTWGTL
jgi:hypothetical protein